MAIRLQIILWTMMIKIIRCTPAVACVAGAWKLWVQERTGPHTKGDMRPLPAPFFLAPIRFQAMLATLAVSIYIFARVTKEFPLRIRSFAYLVKTIFVSLFLPLLVNLDSIRTIHVSSVPSPLTASCSLPASLSMLRFFVIVGLKPPCRDKKIVREKPELE